MLHKVCHNQRAGWVWVGSHSGGFFSGMIPVVSRFEFEYRFFFVDFFHGGSELPPPGEAKVRVTHNSFEQDRVPFLRA